MLKSKELATPTSCLNKAAHDEPIFVLRANGPIAAMAIRLWASMSAGYYHEDEKIKEALALADEMDDWRKAYVVQVGTKTLDNVLDSTKNRK